MDFVPALNVEPEENNRLTELTNVQADPLTQASLLTDDNSDQEISLNYSDDKITSETDVNKYEEITKSGK